MSKNRIKQAMALLLALVLIVGGTALNPTPATAAAGKTIKVLDSELRETQAANYFSI